MALKNQSTGVHSMYVPTLDPPKHFAKPWRSLFAFPLETFDRDSCCLSSEHSADSTNGTHTASAQQAVGDFNNSSPSYM